MVAEGFWDAVNGASKLDSAHPEAVKSTVIFVFPGTSPLVTQFRT